MDEQKVKVYGYRWVVLLVFALVNLIVQLQWLTFAPVATIAQGEYHATALQIDMLSMIYMIVFIIFSIPASYIIDTYGLRIGVGIGAVLVAVFGVLKGLYAANFTVVFIAQTGLAISQPLVANAISKVSVHWFPKKERATASGLATLAMYIGIVVAMILTPILVSATGGGRELRGMLLIYGFASLAVAVLFLLLMRERPATPPVLGEKDERFNVRDGLRHIFAQRSMVLLICMSFIGLGMFNAVSTVIDQIGGQKGFSSDQSGLIGGMMLIGGIIGAVVVPILSDRTGKRRPFLIACFVGAFPGLLGITLFSSYSLVLASAFVLGFFVMSAGPIGFQYSAEVTYPAPESSSQGMIFLAGNLSGIIFIFGADGIGINPLLFLFLALVIVSVILSLFLRESPLILTQPADT